MGKKLAIVHDYLNQMGGAERVVKQFHALYPQAPVYTSIYDRQKMPADFRDLEVHPSFMQYLPLVFLFFKLYLPFYPLAFEGFNLSGFEIILSSSSAFAKGIRKPAGALHFCYCHTPAKFLWLFDLYSQKEEFNLLVKALLPVLLTYQRQWDIKNSKAVDFFIANSQNVAQRIKQFYGRDSIVINPPVDTSFFLPSEEAGGFFLVVSRLTTYKRIDLVVEAFNELGLPLKIIGKGPAQGSLASRAKNNIEFLGLVSDQELARNYAACRALVFPGEEDFGLVPLEAMSAGRPVIAYGRGGALETVKSFENGLLFKEQTKEALIGAVGEFSRLTFDKNKIRGFAQGFDQQVFRKKIKDFIDAKTN